MAGKPQIDIAEAQKVLLYVESLFWKGIKADAYTKEGNRTNVYSLEDTHLMFECLAGIIGIVKKCDEYQKTLAQLAHQEELIKDNGAHAEPAQKPKTV